jgi:hypothetical protein
VDERNIGRGAADLSVNLALRMPRPIAGVATSRSRLKSDAALPIRWPWTN